MTFQKNGLKRESTEGENLNQELLQVIASPKLTRPKVNDSKGTEESIPDFLKEKEN